MLSGTNALAYPLNISTTSVTEKKLYKFGIRFFCLKVNFLTLAFKSLFRTINPFLRFSQKFSSKKVKTDFFDEKCFFLLRRRRPRNVVVDTCQCVVGLTRVMSSPLIGQSSTNWFFYLFFEPVFSPGNGTTWFWWVRRLVVVRKRRLWEEAEWEDGREGEKKEAGKKHLLYTLTLSLSLSLHTHTHTQSLKPSTLLLSLSLSLLSLS